MKIFALLAWTAVLSSNAFAFNYKGGYLTQVSCKYEYNSDFGTGGYVGEYKGQSGDIYSLFFPADQYGWCPY